MLLSCQAPWGRAQFLIQNLNRPPVPLRLVRFVSFSSVNVAESVSCFVMVLPFSLPARLRGALNSRFFSRGAKCGPVWPSRPVTNLGQPLYSKHSMRSRFAGETVAPPHANDSWTVRRHRTLAPWQCGTVDPCIRHPACPRALLIEPVDRNPRHVEPVALVKADDRVPVEEEQAGIAVVVLGRCPPMMRWFDHVRPLILRDRRDERRTPTIHSRPNNAAATGLPVDGMRFTFSAEELGGRESSLRCSPGDHDSPWSSEYDRTT